LALPRARRKYRAIETTQLGQVPWVTGCCLLARRECVQDLGGLDPSFFLYYEDVDFCRRAQARGWSVWHEPRLWAVHHAPLQMRSVPPALRVVTRHALLTYTSRHWPSWQHRVVATLVGVEARLRQWWARWCGEESATEHFRILAELTGDLAQRDPSRARKRLAGVIRHLEEIAWPPTCRS
jgi:GT2 family glycosyltransferase